MSNLRKSIRITAEYIDDNFETKKKAVIVKPKHSEEHAVKLVKSLLRAAAETQQADEDEEAKTSY